MAVVLRGLFDLLREVSQVTGKLKGVTFVKLKPLVHEPEGNVAKEVAAGAVESTIIEQTAKVNEAFIIIFAYGSVDASGHGNENIVLNFIGPDEEPIAKFNSRILSIESDKPVIFNPAIVVEEGKTYKVNATNKDTANPHSVLLQLWGFRLETRPFRR